MRAVFALGGNAIAPSGTETVTEQRDRIAETARAVSSAVDAGDDVALTHGNGPQVGQLLLEQGAASVPERPLDVLVAETQAQIGYLVTGEFDGRIDARATVVVTRARVDPADPAFEDPTKPVGPRYDEAEAAEKPFETTAVTTPEGERAHRRVVPSPRPTEVLEIAEIRRLLDGGAAVVCAGGGGVPVVEEGSETEGVEAVVDKDHTTSLVARAIAADCVVMVTDVECAYRDFGTPAQRPIREADATEMRAALERGAFEAGSMRPKVEACLAFLDGGGNRAVITDAEHVDAALEGTAGTRIHPP